MTDRTSCLRHRANGRFFVIHEDTLDACETVYQRAVDRKVRYITSSHTLSATIRVLEGMTNMRRDELCRIRECEPDQLAPCDLYLSVTYSDFRYWSLKFYSESSFQHALSILESEELVQSRYILIDRNNQPVVGNDGQPVIVAFKDAVPKAKQYRLITARVQALIDHPGALPRPLPPPPGEGDLTGEDTIGGEDEAGGSPETTNHTGAPPLQGAAVAVEGVTSDQQETPHKNDTSSEVKLLASTCSPLLEVPGGTSRTTKPLRRTPNPPLGEVPGPAGKTPSNKESKNHYTQESPSKGEESSPSSFLDQDSSEICSPLPLDEPLVPETVIALAKAILGPIPPKDLETAYHSAERLLQQTSTLEAYDARYRLEAVMHYMVDDNSPSWWVSGRAARSPVKLWQLADNFAGQWFDLIGHHWDAASMPDLFQYQRAYIDAEKAKMAAVEAELSQDPQPKEVVTEELAPPVEVCEEPEEPEEPPGMSTEAAQILIERIDQEAPPAIKFGWRRSTGGGFVVRVGISESQEVWLYAPDEWEALRAELEEKERQWQARWAALKAKMAAPSPPRCGGERRAVA